MNLTEKQKLKKQEISKLELDSWCAMLIRECFQDIYKATSSEEFKRLLKRWYLGYAQKKLDPIKHVTKTIKRHWDGGKIQWDTRRIKFYSSGCKT